MQAAVGLTIAKSKLLYFLNSFEIFNIVHVELLAHHIPIEFDNRTSNIEVECSV